MPIPLGVLAVAGAGAAGAAGAYELLETEILTGSQASVTFSSLGSYSAYQHLQLRITVQSTFANTDDNFQIRFNGDTGNNYAWHRIIGTGSTIVSSASSSISRSFIGAINAASGNADSYSGLVVDVLDFSSSSKNTTVRAFGGQTSTSYVYLYSGLYNSTNAITSIELTAENGNMTVDSRFSLYGLRSA